jgi:hypothetical protein
MWLAVLGSAATTAEAQAPAPPGPFVVDLRAGGSGLPRDVTYFPPVPSGTLVPTGGPAIEAGAHVYLISLGPARIGIGASVLRARGRTSPQAASSSSESSATTSGARPGVETSFTALAPQLSFNFGSAAGWSYLSAGIGPARARASASSFETASSLQDGDDRVLFVTTVPEQSFEPSLRDINLGGGARWFTNRHFAISFDVRLHIVSGRSGETPPLRTTLAVATAGISLK